MKNLEVSENSPHLFSGLFFQVYPVSESGFFYYTVLQGNAMWRYVWFCVVLFL